MTQMNPHWQTTDDEVPVNIRVKEHAAVQTHAIASTPAAKRSPAAFFGIAVILVAGFFAFGGMDLILPAQLAASPTVTISDSGVTPAEITVQAGQKITWTNTSSIPQILVSKTLKDGKGKLFETPPVFPNTQVSFDIPATTPAGTYDFESNTSADVSGTIIVTSSTPAAPAAVSSVSSTPAAPVQMSASSVTPAQVQQTASSPDVQAADLTARNTVAGVPVNPFTVGNTFTGNVTKGTTQAVTTHRPIAQPESGAGLWVAALAGCIALGIVVKSASLNA